MNYPKKVMSITELADMGFPKRLLTNYTHIANQNFAFKTAENGKWLFDTDEFDKFIHSFGAEQEERTSHERTCNQITGRTKKSLQGSGGTGRNAK